MSGKQKALLILLAVALIVLFVLAVGVNSGKQKGDPSARNGFVDFLAKLGAKGSAVDPTTVTPGDTCAAVPNVPNTYKFTGSCTLTVADPGKMKSLIITSNKQFDIHAPAPGGADFTVDGTAKPSPAPTPSAVAKVAVDQRTDVVVTCPGLGTTCIITIVAE